MATTGIRLPASNPAGNNQTNPATGGIGRGVKPSPISMPYSGGNGAQQNPYYSAPQGGTLPTTSVSTGATGSTPITGTGIGQTGSLYDTSSSYSNGMTNIEKQLIDIYGKGVGGELNNLLQGMSGTDSAIFQQYLAGMKPVEASERAQLSGTLGSEGVSGNSSVNAIAQSNLTSQFNAQASQVNAQLMQQQLQDTIGILQGTQSDAAKEVASSGWGVFADVMNNITGDIGNLTGGSFKSSGSNYNNIGASDPTQGTMAPQLGGLTSGGGSSDAGGQFGGDWMGNADGAQSIDMSIFDTDPSAGTGWTVD